MIPIPLGLLSWLTLGLIIGASGAALLPSPRPTAMLRGALAGMGGALAAGLLATVLRFGGLVSFDVRALLVAGMGAMVALMLWQTARLTAEG